MAPDPASEGPDPRRESHRRDRPPNPYILTPLTDTIGFHGRDSVLQFVRNTLGAPYQNVVVLYGQRRIGKTSVLYQLTRPEQTPVGFRPVYFDLQGRGEHRLEQVLYGLAREVARNLGLAPPMREDFRDESFFQYGFLPQAYASLGGQRLLVLVDEFDVLGGEEVTPEAAYHRLFGYLQDLLIDEQRRLAFVFVVGRRLDELPSRIKSTFKSAQCKRISVLGRRSAENLIRGPIGGSLDFADDAVEGLWALTAGHPYLLQLLCYELFERAVRAGRRQVRAEDVDDDLIATAMEMGMGGLAWFWDEFPPAERFLLSAIAEITQTGPSATLRRIGDALREHGVGLQGMELSTAPTVLSDWEVIESTGPDAYRFRVEFVRRWILTKHSLDEAKRELEQVSSRAVALYERARRMHRSGDLSNAASEYGRALAANPNHARARLGLAQAHYESGRLDQALEAFEKAYRLDPESAREGLISVHRDKAVALEGEQLLDQSRGHYLRVLDLDPNDTSSMLRLRDSWRSTAGAHLAGGQWDKAIECYRQALRYAPEDEVLLSTVRTLEQRHMESEAVQRRRRQLERAVLEARLHEEEARRYRVERSAARALSVMLTVGATTSLAGALIVGHGADRLHGGLWLMVAGMSLIALYAAYAWSTRHL